MTSDPSLRQGNQVASDVLTTGSKEARREADSRTLQDQEVWAERDGDDDSYVFGERGVGDFGSGGVGFCSDAELVADYVGGKAGAEEAAVDRGALLFVKRTVGLAEAALDAGTHERGFIGFGEYSFQRRFDVPVRDAAGAEFARDAEFSLATLLRVDAGVVAGVARVVEVLHFLQFLQDGFDVFFIFGAAFEICAHFVDRVRTSHQSSQCGGVEFGFAGMFSRRRGAHGKRIAFWRLEARG